MIRLRLFGAVDLVDRDSGLPVHSVLAQPSRTALLAFLALDAGGGPISRDRLVGIFWPDFDRARARAALRRALWFLRSELGHPVLPGKGSAAVALSTDRVECDAWAFERAVRTGRDEEAARIYGGALLEGLTLPDGGEFERWLDGRRSRYREAALQAMLRAAERYEDRNDLLRADRWLNRALGVSPDSEVAARRRIALLARAGRSADAIRVFRGHARRLEVDYDLEPAPETRRLVEAVLIERRPGHPVESSPSVSSGPPEPSGGVLRAWATMDEGSHANASARSLFLELVRRDEGTAEGHGGLAAALAHEVQLFGGPREALAAAVASGHLAVSIDSRSPRARLGLGLALEVSGRLTGAAEAYETALRLDPACSRARSSLVRTRILAGDFASACFTGRVVAESEDSDPHAHLQVAVGLFCLGRVDSATRWYEATRARWPEFPWAEGSLAYLALTHGETELAAQLTRRMIESDDHGSAGLGPFSAGMVALHRGEARAARAAFDTVYRSDPDTRHGALLLSARTFLAHLSREAGEDDVAEELLRDASASNMGLLATGAAFGGVFYDQAVVRALQGRSEEALDWLEASLAAGYRQAEYAARDPLLAPLRREDRFSRFLAATRASVMDQRKSIGPL